jgi:hypothetical protein
MQRPCVPPLAGVKSHSAVAMRARPGVGPRGRGRRTPGHGRLVVAALPPRRAGRSTRSGTSWSSDRVLGRWRNPGGMTVLLVSLCRLSPARSCQARPAQRLPRRRRPRNAREARLVAWEGTRVGSHLRRRPVRVLRRRVRRLERRRRQRTLASSVGWLVTSARTARNLSSASCVAMYLTLLWPALLDTGARLGRL